MATLLFIQWCSRNLSPFDTAHDGDDAIVINLNHVTTFHLTCTHVKIGPGKETKIQEIITRGEEAGQKKGSAWLMKISCLINEKYAEANKT